MIMRIIRFFLSVFLLAGFSVSVLGNKSAEVKEIYIPGGYYYTGLKGSYDNPEKRRYFKGFYIDVHPVTNKDYVDFIKKSGYKPQNRFDIRRAEGEQQKPVTGLTLSDCQAFADFYGKRVPSEWEWEIAARSLKRENIYVNGKVSSKYEGNFLSSRIYKKVDVMTYKPNSLGLFGMEGNIYEWTTGKYEKEFIIGDVPVDTELRVIRGGSWTNQPYDIKTTTRTPFPADRSLDWIGFRCVRYPAADKKAKE